LKIRIAKNERLLISGLSLLLLSISITGWWFVGDAALILLILMPGYLALMLLATFQASHRISAEYRRQLRKQESQLIQDFRQIEALFSLFFTLKPTSPLPESRGWAASPDLLRKITEVVLTEKPDLVVEASSGVSTLVIAYCLKRLGKGKVFSLEHDAQYAAVTQKMLELHGLGHIATVIHAPLRQVVINNKEWLWYDLDLLNIDQPIDLLVIDGPPGHIQELSRYPALPLLYRMLNVRSTIIMDDCNRKDEQEVIALWKKDFNQLTAEFINLEKGAYLFHKDDQASHRG
jgi:predicted O-methyltransferase YrrM